MILNMENQIILQKISFSSEQDIIVIKHPEHGIPR